MSTQRYSLLVACSQQQLDKLQCILNCAARVIYRGRHGDHVTPLLRDNLHWLRIRERMTLKLCLVVYKATRTIPHRWHLHPGSPPNYHHINTTIAPLDRPWRPPGAMDASQVPQPGIHGGQPRSVKQPASRHPVIQNCHCIASSALQHWTASPTKEGCHWQAGGENRQTWLFANAAWYT